MSNYEKTAKALWKKLLSNCDENLQKLYNLGWDACESYNECDPEDLDDELKKTCEWIEKNGYSSVSDIIDSFIRIFEACSIPICKYDEYISLFYEKTDGYFTPLAEFVAYLDKPEKYTAAGDEWLTDRESKKCWELLSEAEREHLESLDWDDLSYEDEKDIYVLGRYNVRIEVAFGGKISFSRV